MSLRHCAVASVVSIPMTVLGGLQYNNVFSRDSLTLRFNTDDGIRRAAITRCVNRIRTSIIVSIPMTVLGGLQ